MAWSVDFFPDEDKAEVGKCVAYWNRDPVDPNVYEFAYPARLDASTEKQNVMAFIQAANDALALFQQKKTDGSTIAQRIENAMNQ